MTGFQLADQQARRYEAVTRVFMDGSAQILASTAGVRPGDAVLDVACGTGLVARHALPLVGPDGRVAGTDVNAAMLAVAQSVAPAGIEWIESPADAQPFADATFDHVLCQHGLQFFPDQIAAIAEWLRVLRPTGSLRATVWFVPGGNPYIEKQLEILAAIDPALLPSIAVAVRAEADRLMIEWASAAGATGVAVDTIEHVAVIADLGRFFVDQTASTPWGPTLAALGAEERAAWVAELCAALERYRDGSGRYSVPFRSFRLSATAG